MSDEQPEPIKVTVTADGITVYGEVGGCVRTTRIAPGDRPMFSSTIEEPKSSQDLSDQKIEALYKRVFGEPSKEGK